MGEQGAESIHAAINGAYGSVTEKVKQLECILLCISEIFKAVTTSSPLCNSQENFGFLEISTAKRLSGIQETSGNSLV